MRAVFSIVGLVVVLAIVGVLVKKQVSAGVAPTASGMPGTAATPQQQVQQFKNAAEAAMQQARPMPEEPK